MREVVNHKYGQLLFMVIIFMINSCASFTDLYTWENPDAPMNVTPSTKISFAGVGKIIKRDSVEDKKGKTFLPMISHSLDSLNKMSIPILEESIRTGPYGYIKGDSVEANCFDTTNLHQIPKKNHVAPPRLALQCQTRLQASGTQYLISIPLVKIYNKRISYRETQCAYNSFCNSISYEYYSPGLITQVAVYDIEKQTVVKSIVFDDSLSKFTNLWEDRIYKYSARILDELPLDYALKPHLKREIKSGHHAIEFLIGGYFKNYVGGDFYEINQDPESIVLGAGFTTEFRYVKKSWGIGYSYGKEVTDTESEIGLELYPSSIHRFSGYWFPVRASWVKLGLFSGINYSNIESGDYEHIIRFLEDNGYNLDGSGFGYTIGTVFDFLLPYDTRISLSSEYESISGDFGRSSINGSALSFKMALGWGLRLSD